jgi:predicted TIM-barrel fold metal-dependent hydrolase
MAQIIDAHSHYMPPEVAKHTAFFKVHWSDVDRQLEVMDKLGIDKSLLFYPTSDAHLNMGGWTNVCRSYNSGISEVVKKYPKRFIGAGILPVDNDENVLAELKRFGELDIRIISLASSYDGKYLDDEKFFPVFDYAQKHQIPIHVHPQILNPIGEERVKDPLLSPVLEYVFDVSMCIGKMMMEGVFSKYKDVNFIFAHYGGVLPFVRERFDNTYRMLRKRDYVKDIGKLPGEYLRNLYLDTSGSKSAGSLQCALEVVDASHILFGSDFPANQSIPDSISVIQNSSLDDEQKSAILGNNTLCLFRM